MSRKISPDDKQQWLQSYKKGASQHSIAHEFKRDVRTVNKVIEEMRLREVSTVALADLIKGKMQGHHEKLIGIVTDLMSAFEPPPSRQEVPWGWQSGASSLPIRGGKADYEFNEQPKITRIVLDAESKPEWQPLSQHLKVDPLWKAIGQWKRALASHLEARMTMKREMTDKLLGNNYVISDEHADELCFYSHSVDFLFETAIQRLLSLADTSDFENGILVDKKAGDVRYGDSTLARALGEEEECRKHIIDVFHKVQNPKPAETVKKTYGELLQQSKRARQCAEEIRMLGFLPGQCRICRRLGL